MVDQCSVPTDGNGFFWHLYILEVTSNTLPSYSKWPNGFAHVRSGNVKQELMMVREVASSTLPYWTTESVPKS